MSELGLPRMGILPWSFGSASHGPSSLAPTTRLPYVAEGLCGREQYPPSRSALRGNQCSTGVSHPSPLVGWYMGEGPIASPGQIPPSEAQGPGAGPEASSCRGLHLGLFSVGVGRLEEARATALTCRDTYSRLLTRLSSRSPGGPGVRSRLLSSVGPLYNGRSVVFCCVRGSGRPPVWRTVVSPVLMTPFLF